jgi:tetratricopeptide (TPR) repeat protein
MTFLFKNREYLKFLMDQEEWSRALPIALLLAPDSASDTVTLAIVYSSLGDETSVDRVIQKAIYTWPLEPTPAIWWSTHQLELGSVDRAHEGACNIRPGIDQAAFYYHSLMAKIYSQIGDYEESLSSAEIATKLANSNEQKENIEIGIAEIFFALMQPVDAMERLRQVIAVNPHNESALNLTIDSLTIYRKWQELHDFIKSICAIAKPSMQKKISQSMITCLIELREYQEATALIDYYSLTADEDDSFLVSIRQRLSIAWRNFNNRKQSLEKLAGEIN